ncbi:MAG: phage protease [Peptococcaceae bacterium]|nr:phage protease [Peptococcaceae bacterium]
MSKTLKLLVLDAHSLPQGPAPELIRILPLGTVKSTFGQFTVDAESFTKMKAQMEGRALDLVVDYEHQTLKNVQAPAAAWIKELVLAADAIMARVEWTPKGREYVANGEYRYTSPVIQVRKSDGKVVGLHSVALTNTPAIDGQFTIANKDIEGTEGEDQMELIKLLAKLLGLPETATEEEVLAAVKTLTEQAAAPLVANKTVADLLGLDAAKSKTEDYCAAILALKNAQPGGDYLALKARLDQRDAEDAVGLAMKEGKITGATREWALSYALKDPAGFKGFLAKAPVVVPGGELDILEPKSNQKPPQAGEALRLVCKQMGISTEAALKALKEEE